FRGILRYRIRHHFYDRAGGRDEFALGGRSGGRGAWHALGSGDPGVQRLHDFSVAASDYEKEIRTTMSATIYYEKMNGLLGRIHGTQAGKIEEAAQAFATAIATGRKVYLFGSGHSVIPVLDIFPRYGSFVGFVPLYDPRLMWTNVVGPGGARELLWLETREGYVEVFL